MSAPVQGTTSPTATSGQRRSAGGGGVRYHSRDVASEPPTSIVIARSESDLEPHDPLSRHAILESDIEPTEGWNTRHHKSQLSVCFMHSFGKCVGRYQSDPSTCHQIHVKQHVIEALRAKYTNPVRRFFSRTVKAHLTPELLNVISQVAHKELTLQYLEYLAHDVRETEGLHKYERSYRAWLTAPGGFVHAFHDISVPHCAEFALRGHCGLDKKCPGVHAHLCRAQVRDNIVINALRILSAPFEQCGGATTSGSVSPSGDHDGSRRVSPAMSPRHPSNQRGGSQSSSISMVLSGQVSPVSQSSLHHPQHMTAYPHPSHQSQHHQQAQQQSPYGMQQQFQQQGNPSNNNGGMAFDPRLAATSPVFLQQQHHLSAHDGQPSNFVSYQHQQQQQQPVYVVVMQGGPTSGNAVSPPQMQVPHQTYQPAFLMPTYQQQHQQHGTNDGSPCSMGLQPQQQQHMQQQQQQHMQQQMHPFSADDFQVRLDLGTLSGQTSPQSFASVDVFNQQQRSRSPNPTAVQPFSISLNPASGGLWAGPSTTGSPPSQQGGSVFVPSVYRVDQSGMFLLDQQHQQSQP